MTLLTIGQLAASSATPATALRYYDQVGVLVPVRLPNGHRRYPPEAMQQLQLIKLCQALGCTLQEITVLVGQPGGRTRRETAARKLAELEGTLTRLVAVRDVLRHLATCHHASDQSSQCQETVQAALDVLTPAAAPDHDAPT